MVTTVSAKEIEVMIYDKEIKINDNIINNKNSKYPVLKYNNNIYYPLRSDFCKNLGIIYDKEYLKIDNTTNLPEVSSINQNLIFENDFSYKYNAEIKEEKITIDGNDYSNAEMEKPLIEFGKQKYIALDERDAALLNMNYEETDKGIVISKKSNDNIYNVIRAIESINDIIKVNAKENDNIARSVKEYNRVKIDAENKKTEEEKLKKEAEEKARLAKLEEDKRKAEEERLRKEAEEKERLAKLEEDKRKAEEERLRKEAEEKERLAKLEEDKRKAAEERLRKETEEKERLAKLEADKRKAEEERLRKETEEKERLAKLEADKRKAEEERLRKETEEKERLAKLEEDKRKAEEERLRKETEEKARLVKLEAEKRKIEEERLRKEAEEKARIVKVKDNAIKSREATNKIAAAIALNFENRMKEVTTGNSDKINGNQNKDTSINLFDDLVFGKTDYVIANIDKVDLNKTNNFGKTLLIVAIENEKYEVAKKILELKSDLNVAANNGKTALMAAIEKGQYNIVSSIIANGADIDIKNNRDNYALNMAIEFREFEIAELLVNSGANLNNKINNGETILIKAVKDGNSELVKAIIEKDKKSINVKDDKGNTPLIHASMRRKSDVYEILVSAGADSKAKNNFGKDAMFYLEY
jgi:ankyrin repeat protein